MQNEHPCFLVAFDYSPAARHALDFALLMANEVPNAELYVAHFHNFDGSTGAARTEYTVMGDRTSLVDEAQRLRDAVSEALRGPGATISPNRVRVHVDRGDPAAGIVKLATDLGARMIVVGTHGRRGVERLVLGSVAEKIVRTAACPVLVAHNEAAREAALVQEQRKTAERIEPPPGPGEGSHLGRRHTYHQGDRNAEAHANAPLVMHLER